MIDASLAKKISSDWQSNLHGLHAYTRNKIYKIAGPLIIGIDLIRVRWMEEYRPHYVVYSLWGNKMGTGLKECLGGPVIMYHIKNRKGFQFDIPYSQHEHYFPEAAACAREQALTPFDRDIILPDFINGVKSCMDGEAFQGRGSGIRAYVFEFLIDCSLYLNDADEINRLLGVIYEDSESWNMNQFKSIYGEFTDWFHRLNNKMFNRQQFMDIVETNKSEKSLQKLMRSELVKSISFF